MSRGRPREQPSPGGAASREGGVEAPVDGAQRRLQHGKGRPLLRAAFPARQHERVGLGGAGGRAWKPVPSLDLLQRLVVAHSWGGGVTVDPSPSLHQTLSHGQPRGLVPLLR